METQLSLLDLHVTTWLEILKVREHPERSAGIYTECSCTQQGNVVWKRDDGILS